MQVLHGSGATQIWQWREWIHSQNPVASLRCNNVLLFEGVHENYLWLPPMSRIPKIPKISLSHSRTHARLHTRSNSILWVLKLGIILSGLQLYENGLFQLLKTAKYLTKEILGSLCIGMNNLRCNNFLWHTSSTSLMGQNNFLFYWMSALKHQEIILWPQC